MLGPLRSLPSGAPAFRRISATGYPAVLSLNAFLVGDANGLMLKCGNIGDAEIEMIRHLASDVQRYGLRRLRKRTRGRAQKHREQRPEDRLKPLLPIEDRHPSLSES